jgi:hypothetical protein
MELKDFIKGTITAIIESVSELNNELADKGVIIAPRNAQLAIHGVNDKNIFVEAATKAPIYNVDFNLSISESSASDGKSGVNIKVIDLGTSNKIGNENLNSVRFTIPIIFPSCK